MGGPRGRRVKIMFIIPLQPRNLPKTVLQRTARQETKR